MKLEKLLNKAKKEVKNIEEEQALELVKSSLKRIKSCERTLRQLKKAHKKLLNTEVDDVELNDYEY